MFCNRPTYCDIFCYTGHWTGVCSANFENILHIDLLLLILNSIYIRFWVAFISSNYFVQSWQWKLSIISVREKQQSVQYYVKRISAVQNAQPNKYLLGQFAAFAVGQCSMPQRYKPYQRLRNRTVKKIKF